MQNDTDTAVIAPPSGSGAQARASTAPVPAAPTLDLEPAEWGDMEEVVEIIRSSASWYEEFVKPEDFSEHLVDKEWARQNFSCRDFFVARLEDEVVGTVTLQNVDGDHVYLGYVYLHEDHVGNGLGRALLDFARDETQRRGRKSMVLIAHPEATWACRAYEKYGFEVIARERNEVLAWEGGWLEPYHEEGFELYQYRV